VVISLNLLDRQSIKIENAPLCDRRLGESLIWLL
jgi:hypothetical protein